MAMAFVAAVRLTVSNDTLLAIIITALAIIFIPIIFFIGVLALFPFGRLPLWHLVKRFVIWASCILCPYIDKPEDLDIQEGKEDKDKDNRNKDTDTNKDKEERMRT